MHKPLYMKVAQTLKVREVHGVFLSATMHVHHVHHVHHVSQSHALWLSLAPRDSYCCHCHVGGSAVLGNQCTDETYPRRSQGLTSCLVQC